MTPTTIIQQAAADGVSLALSPSSSSTIQATGKGEAVSRWLPLIREHKPGIVAAFLRDANDSQTTAEQEAAIRTWLVHIEETDPGIIAEVMDKCHADPGALAYFLERADELPSLDNDRRCSQCTNLSGRGICLAAKRGDFFAGLNYQPVCDLPRRCESYSPGPDDPDRRHGRQRWPGLLVLGVNHGE